MSNLKLAKLPDRTPVKITISVNPDLNEALHTYAALYRDAYHQEESVPDLIPFMLEAFLAGDRSFRRAHKDRPVEKDGHAQPGRQGRASDG